MENIKLESDLRLENIFISLSKDTLTRLNDLLDTNEIDLLEKSTIRKYMHIVNQIGNIPSIEMMRTEFPSLYFEDVEKLSEDELDDYIRLYISSKKNLAASKKLLEMSSLVKTNGITEEIVNQLNNLTKSDTVSISHEDISDKLLDIYKKKIDDIGIRTSVKQIDEDTGGLQPGTITTILGFTGSFKTTWALNMAYNAMVDGMNILYLSLEVTKEKVFFSLLSRHSFEGKFKTHIDNSKLKKKQLDDKEFEYLESDIYPDFQKLKGKVYVVDESELEAYSFFALENKFREIDKLAIAETGHGIDLLVIDHAQLLKFDASMKGIGNETNVVNAYVSFFRQEVLNWIKSGKSIAGLILSQSSREGWKEAVRAEGKYRLTALAEANELERASSVVLSVYSSDSLKAIKSAKVQILKNRDGEVWSEPMEIFVDPVYYAFGDVQGAPATSTSFDIGNINNLFSMDEESVNELSALANEPDLNSIDLDI